MLCIFTRINLKNNTHLTLISICFILTCNLLYFPTLVCKQFWKPNFYIHACIYAYISTSYLSMYRIHAALIELILHVVNYLNELLVTKICIFSVQVLEQTTVDVRANYPDLHVYVGGVMDFQRGDSYLLCSR